MKELRPWLMRSRFTLVTHNAVGFDRRMPAIDFDALDLPTKGTLPLGVPGAAREGGARNRQQPRRTAR